MPTTRKTFFAVLLSAAPAWLSAQEDAVVITATRVPQPSLEVPASIDRIYADEIRDGRPQVNLSESLGRVPGIVVQNRQNYAQDLQISSRGFGTRSTFGVRGIRLFADGIPATMPDGQGQVSNFSLSSAERIEVLRGPFSALYGNAAGGVIVIETQDGPEIPTGEASLFLGSYDTWRAGAKFGGQWGGLNAIGDVSRFETDGYRAHSAARRDHLNAKLKYGFSEATSLTVVANSLRQPENQDPLGLNRNQLAQDPRQATSQAFAFNTRKTVEQDQVGLVLNQKLSNGRLAATLYGGQRFVEQFLGFAGGPTLTSPNPSGGVVQLDREYGGGALRYASEGPLRFAAGAEYEHMSDRRKGFVNSNGTAGALLRDEDNIVSSAGLYAQAEWEFVERWTAHGGLRTNRVRVRLKDYFIVGTNPDDTGAREFSATTPVAGVLFRATKLLSVYANIGRGFETPTFAEVAYRRDGTGMNFDLQASKSRHAEVGAKGILPGRARLTAALFDIVTDNEIVVDVNQGGRTIFKNAGHTDRDGVELAAETLLEGPFQARIAYTYLKAVFREGFNTVAAGNLLPGVPRSQLYGELRYRKEPFYAQLEGVRKSRIAVNDVNTEFADGYSVFNVMGGLVQQGGRWRLTEFVRVDNITDRNYVGSVIVNEGNSRFYEPSPRRNYSFGVQASLQF